ncbi:wrapper [Musca autumnalis]|uniref:wrapper n=1 Tax=Musca autumnalis TaxID=221902 RepID=UPI003CEA8B75
MFRQNLASFTVCLMVLHFSSFVGSNIINSLATTVNSNNNNNEEEAYSRDFYSVPTTVKTYENDTVLLPCDYKSSYRSVRWLRDEDFLMEAPYMEEVSQNRYHLLSNGSLLVMDVQTEDTGRYFCEMLTASEKAVQAHAIEVQYPPKVYATPSGFIELPIGAVLEIICETEGVPQPAVSWTYNNETIIDYLVGNRQTHIVEIKSRNMSGNIECVAQNGVGQPVTDGVELLVMFPPEIRSPQKIYYSKVGGRIQMDCYVESAPLAKMRWFHAGKLISMGSYYTRQDVEMPANNSYNNNHPRYYSDMKHSLILKNVRESDMGMYECRAENPHGVQSNYMELTFRPMPCTFKISPDMQSPTSHTLVWQTESFSPVIEFKLKFRQVPSETTVSFTTLASRPEWTELTIPSDISIGPIYTTTYTLYGLYPASIYQVVVLARNHYGWSDSSKILRFATGGEVEFPNYSTESDSGISGTTDDDDDGLANDANNVLKSGATDGDHDMEITSNDITERSIVAEKDKTLYSSMYAFSSSSSASTASSALSARSSYCDLILNWCTINCFVIIIVHKCHT